MSTNMRSRSRGSQSLDVRSWLVVNQTEHAQFGSLRLQPREGTYYSHCAFARYVARIWLPRRTSEQEKRMT